jgi:hypothetical protein
LVSGQLLENEYRMIYDLLKSESYLEQDASFPSWKNDKGMPLCPNSGTGI